MTDKGLIAAWSFDKNGSKVIQCKVNAKNLLVGSGKGITQGNSFYTDGTGAYYDIQSPNAIQKLTDKFTVSWWLKRTTTSGFGGTWNYNFAASRNTWNLQVTSAGRLQILVQINTTTYALAYVDGYVPNANQWYHVVGIYDGTQSVSTDRALLFVNGVKMSATYSGTMPTTIYDNTSGNLRVQWATTTLSWINEPKIWDRPLSASEVRELYVQEKNFIR